MGARDQRGDGRSQRERQAMIDGSETTAEKAAQVPKRAVLLLAHGTPETVEEVPEYLRNVVRGHTLPQAVVEEIQRRYAQIGKSPLTEWTLRQAELLRQTLGVPVYVGMRNWKPTIAEAVRAMRDEGVTEAVAICLAPQNSRTSVGLYRRAAYAETGDTIRLHFIESWADHPRLMDAFAERLRPVWQQACHASGARIPVLFTAHSVPCRTIQTAPVQTMPARVPQETDSSPDPYAVEAKRTAALVAERLSSEGLTERDWFFAFQSQGISGGPWIGPTVEETLQAIRDEGHAGVVLQPIGFLCDHVEILYDIDIAFQSLAKKIGLNLWRPESLNASPLLIEALADLAAPYLSGRRAK